MASFRAIVAFLVGFIGLFSATAQPWGNFESIVQNYAKKAGEQIGNTVLWADPYCHNPHMVSHPEYHKYQASVEVLGDIKYGAPLSDVSRPAWTFSHWYHNSMSTPVKSKFNKIKTSSDEFQWSVDGNLVFAKDKTKKNFTFIIPPQLGLERKNYTKEFKADEVMYGFSSKHSVVKTDIFNISQEVTVPANKSVQATLVVSEREIEIPWSVDLEISGYFAVWFKKKWDNHYLWFMPVKNLWRESPHFRLHEHKLLYTLKGIFTGVYGTNAQLYLKEFDLKKPEILSVLNK